MGADEEDAAGVCVVLFSGERFGFFSNIPSSILRMSFCFDKELLNFDSISSGEFVVPEFAAL